MIELYQLEQFLTIAQAGTLSKAAEILLISQPALTRSMQRLEEELTIPLFNRKKNKIDLNENGLLAVELAKEVLQNVDHMKTTLLAFSRKKCTISIGSCAPAPIWGLTHILKKLYPEMNLTDTIDSKEARLLQGLKNHEYAIVVLHHPIHEEAYACVELFEEHLYLSVPPANPLALSKEIYFHELDGDSILLFSRIGFWNEICLKMIPNSHLLIQEDMEVFVELTRLSALPNFKSNISLLRDDAEENRVNIPIKDPEAHASYYAVYAKTDQALFCSLQEEIKKLDWKDTLS